MDASYAYFAIAVHSDCMMRFRNEVIYLLGELRLDLHSIAWGVAHEFPRLCRNPAAVEQRLCDSDESYPTLVPAPDVKTAVVASTASHLFFSHNVRQRPTPPRLFWMIVLIGMCSYHHLTSFIRDGSLIHCYILLCGGSSNNGLRDAKSAS